MTFQQLDEKIVSGFFAYINNELNKANEICNEAFALCKELNYQQGLAGCHALQGRLFTKNQQWQQAIDEIQKSVVVLKGIGNTVYAAQGLYTLAFYSYKVEQYSSSIQYATESLELFRLLKDVYGEADSLFVLAAAYNQKAEHEKVLEYGLLAHEIFIKNNLLDRAGSQLINIAVHYIDKGEFAEAIDYLQRAITLKTKYKEDLESGLKVIGSAEYIYNKYYFTSKPNDSSLSDAYINLGTAYECIGNYTEASSFLEKALTIKRILGEKYGEAVTLHQIGRIFLSTDDYADAEWYFMQAVPLLETIGNKELAATVYFNLGKISIFNNLLDQARDYLKKSEMFFGEIEYPIGQLLVLEQRIRINLIEKNYQAVFDLANNGIAISSTIPAKIHEVEFLLLLGDVYELTDRPNEAIDCYSKSIAIAHDSDYLSKEQEVLLKLVKLYKKLGNVQEAFTYFEQYQQLKEKIHNIETTRHVKNMQVLHEVELHKKNEELAQSKITQLEMQLIIRQKESDMLNQELAVKSQSMLVQMEETSKFKSEILNITKQLDKAENILRKVKMKLKESPIMQDTWESYVETFSKVHPDFYPLLIRTCPELTSMEIKICILIKAGLKSEEISQILSVSSRTVENHRFHLRKKLGLSDRESLGKFLLNL